MKIINKMEIWIYFWGYETMVMAFSVRILESEPWCVVAKAAPRLDSAGLSVHSYG